MSTDVYDVDGRDTDADYERLAVVLEAAVAELMLEEAASHLRPALDAAPLGLTRQWLRAAVMNVEKAHDLLASLLDMEEEIRATGSDAMERAL